MRISLALLALIACGEEADASFGHGFGRGQSFRRHHPGPPLRPSLFSMPDTAGNNFLCGQPDHLEGNTRIFTCWSFRITASTSGCPSFWDIDSTATDSILRVSCFSDGVGAGPELRFQIGSGSARVNCDSSGFDFRHQEWTRICVDANLSAGTVRGYIASYSSGRIAQNLSCGALPAAFDSTAVTAQLELSPSSLQSSALDNIMIWDDVGPGSDQEVWDFLGDEVTSDPRSAPWGAASNWIPIGEAKGDSMTVLRDAIGQNHCTGAITGWHTTHLPRRTRINEERRGPMDYTFTIANGTEDRINRANGSNDTQGYGINPIVRRYGREKLRYFLSNGGSHAGINHRVKYGHSLDGGRHWPWGFGADYPWSATVETVIEPAQAPVATNLSSGGRGPQCLMLQHQDNNQGAGLCLYNAIYTGTPRVRTNGALVTNWHSDTPTWDEDQTAGVADTFFPWGATSNTSRNAIGGLGVELPNGDVVWTTYGNDSSGACASEYRQHLWRSTSSPWDDASWALESLWINSCGDSPPYRANEPDCLRYIQAPGDGSPSRHGRVYCTFKADDVPPPGGVVDTAVCIYTDSWATDPGDTTPDWFHCADGSVAGPTTINFGFGIPAANHTKKVQLANGTIALSSRYGKADNHGSYVSLSSDFGSTWTSIGNVTPATLEASNGDNVVELRPNKLGVIAGYERAGESVNRTIYLWGEVDSELTQDGPLTWSNTGWCRVNDGGAADEGLTLFGYDVMEGHADGAIAFRYHTDDGAADKSIIARWGVDGGDQAFRIRHLSTEALAIDLGAHHCETSAGAIATNTNHSIALGLDGSGPTLSIYLNGSSIACDQNVSGTVPSTWPTSTAQIRIGIAYDGTEPCRDCFVDELVLYDEITFSGAARAAALIGEDPRQVDIDGNGEGDWPLAYYRCEGENALLSGAAGGDVAENWGWWPTWAHGLNLEVADLGATP